MLCHAQTDSTDTVRGTGVLTLKSMIHLVIFENYNFQVNPLIPYTSRKLGYISWSPCAAQRKGQPLHLVNIVHDEL